MGAHQGLTSDTIFHKMEKENLNKKCRLLPRAPYTARVLNVVGRKFPLLATHLAQPTQYKRPSVEWAGKAGSPILFPML